MHDQIPLKLQKVNYRPLLSKNLLLQRMNAPRHCNHYTTMKIQTKHNIKPTFQQPIHFQIKHWFSVWVIIKVAFIQKLSDIHLPLNLPLNAMYWYMHYMCTYMYFTNYVHININSLTVSKKLKMNQGFFSSCQGYKHYNIRNKIKRVWGCLKQQKSFCWNFHIMTIFAKKMWGWGYP